MVILANMTGANRLLIGIGWALVVLPAWFRFRRQGRPRGGIQLPLVFAVAAGTATGLPVGPAQREELLLTAAQSLFAVAVLVNLAISAREAAALSGLFLVQFALAALVPGATELIVLAVTYLVLAAVLLLRARRRLGPLLRDGLRTPYHQLTDQRGAAPRPGGHRPAGAERREGPS
jgi:hypothetical protein